MLTNNFMINVEADFDKNCEAVEFKALKWKVPLAALTKMQIEVSGEYFKLSVFFDLNELNAIMAKYGAEKKQKKDKRALKFVDRGTLRDFVFHLKRLYHMHRRSRDAKDNGLERPKLIVTEKK